MKGLVEYIDKNSIIHKLNPISKLLWSFVMIALCFITDSPTIIFGVFVLDLFFAFIAKVLKELLPTIKGLIIFALILVLFQIFLITDGNIIFYTIPVINKLPITDIGLNLSLVMAFRMLGMVSTIPIIIATTRMTDLVVVMVEKLKVPFKYAFMFTTALRFIPVFSKELGLIRQAQMSRGYESDTKNPFKRFAQVVPLSVPLLVSSVRKTTNIAISMETRGFNTRKRTYFRDVSIKRLDIIFIFLQFLILFLFIIIF